MPRGRVGPKVVRPRSRSSSHGDVGATQKGTLVEVQWMSGSDPTVGGKNRNANMIQTVQGPWQNYHGPRTKAGRLLRSERRGHCSNVERRSDGGNNPSKRSKVTQPKPDTPQKMRSSKDTRMDQPKAASSKWAAARALQLNMQIYYLLRWLHRSGAVRQETGNT